MLWDVHIFLENSFCRLATVLTVQLKCSNLREMIEIEGPLSKISTFGYRGSSHQHKSAA